MKNKIVWIIIVAAVVLIGLSMYNLELLMSAFVLNPIPRSAQSIQRGRQLFSQYCVACHGAEGRGDGPAAASLPERPEDLQTIAPPPYFPDGVVAYRIANGVNTMPPWKGVLRSEEIWDLLNFIRSLGKEQK